MQFVITPLLEIPRYISNNESDQRMCKLDGTTKGNLTSFFAETTAQISRTLSLVIPKQLLLDRYWSEKLETTLSPTTAEPYHLEFQSPHFNVIILTRQGKPNRLALKKLRDSITLLKLDE